MGCFAFELMTGNPPFVSNNKDLLYRKIINCQPEFNEDKQDIDSINLIKAMLSKKHNERPDIKAVIGHEFFKSVDWKKVHEMSMPSPIQAYLTEKFDINKIHDYYASKKSSRKTNY